jgi:hypothetical protein
MPLVLGTVAFQGFEAPEQIPFGGRQRLNVHRLMGGKRVVDAMGPDDDSIVWRGRFRGTLATLRARQLDLMRRAGRPHILTWGAFVYRVVIERFDASYEAFNEIPYSISCLVVQDLVAEKAGALLDRIEDSIMGDLSDALGLAADSPILTGIVTGAQSAVMSVASGGGFNLSTLGGAALSGLQSGTADAFAQSIDVRDAAMSALPTDGMSGALSSDVETGGAGAVQSVIETAETAYRSAGVSALLGRMRLNLGSVSL